MQIIPVIDLANGVAVHARGGDRAGYAPLESALTPGRAGDALALLRAYRETLGARECYLADLDAIQGGLVQRAAIRALADVETGLPGALLVDAGSHTPAGALEVLACGATQVVIGLETLRAFADLRPIVEIVGPSRIVFSLDLRLGRPILHPAMRDIQAAADPVAVAARAVDAGVLTLLVLDLASVGADCGVDLDLLATLRRRFPEIRLLAGGGVRTRDDLARMQDAGCDGALVASAIHAGRITAAGLR